MAGRWRAWGLITIVAVLCARSAIAQTAIQYVYDDLGRLIAVVDPNGDTANYHYDAVGNLLSIDRHASSQVSIISFSPSSGPIGTAVTISGTGFSATAAQDAATVNGVSATVSSATATQLVVTVPAAATTGAIAVTAPNGSATSASSFTVTATSGAPTITGFTPAIGSPGTAVTVSGTNFDTMPANDRTTLNTRLSTVTSATPTSLGVVTPATQMGGHLTVATPHGTAVSTDDFYVPPAPNTVADVVLTNRVAFGASTSVAIATAGKIALLLFDGTAGHRVSVTFGSMTFAYTWVAVFAPDGSMILSSMVTGNAFFDTPALTAAGTYTLVVYSIDGHTGSATVTVNDVPPDITGTIVPGGSPVTVAPSVPGQKARLTFSGIAGQRVSLNLSNVTIGTSAVSIANPDGSTLTWSWVYTSGGYLDTQTLSTTGTYAVFVDPQSTNTGSMTLTLYDVPADVSGTIVPGGSPVTVTTTVPGQNARLTFSGTAGQRVSLGLSGVTIGTSAVSIVKPDGSTLTWAWVYPSSGYIDTQTLSTTGTYAVFVDPQSTNTGSMTLTLYNVVDVTGTIVPGGSPVTVTTTVPGQNAQLTFSGTVGQQVSLSLSNVTIGTSAVSIANPDGSTLTWAWVYPSSGFIGTQTLGTTGTYTVVVDPQGSYTGSMTVTLNDVGGGGGGGGGGGTAAGLERTASVGDSRSVRQP